jgi:hypothetical protein
VVIVQPFFGSVKEYITTVLTQGCPFSVPERCPHPDCQAGGLLIRWGTYERGALTGEVDHRLRIQRVRCKACGRTHSLLPDFLHPHRHFVISLLQQVISLYLLAGLGWRRLMRQVQAEYDRGPAPSTVQEWVASFAYGAGHLLLDTLLRHLFALDPGIDLPDPPPPLGVGQHLNRTPDSDQRRRLEKAHTFWLLAEQVYVQVKARLPHLHFAATQLFPFLVHWLQSQSLPPRLFWSPVLPTTPTRPF